MDKTLIAFWQFLVAIFVIPFGKRSFAAHALCATVTKRCRNQTYHCTRRKQAAIFFSMKAFLSDKEIAELKADHRIERESRYADRIKAILMLNSGGSAARVAEYLLLDEKTIRNYLDKYLRDGLEGLCSDLSRAKESLLTLKQQDLLVVELRRKIYPSTQAVQAYVKNNFGVSYSMSGITKRLGRLGFSYKKPQAVPGKACAEAQRKFLTDLSRLKRAKSWRSNRRELVTLLTDNFQIIDV